MTTQKDTVHRLLERGGRTFAEDAGINLADQPEPLYRLLVLSVLLSTRISTRIAVAAAWHLTDAGFGSPAAMLDATWQQRVDALGRARYVRYDESTATALGDGAKLLLDDYGGDVRALRGTDLHRELQRFPRLGPVGADIFCREAQLVWPELRPYLDGKALDGAKRIGLPAVAKRLAGLVGGDDLARFSAALVRVRLDAHLAEEVRAA